MKRTAVLLAALPLAAAAAEPPRAAAGGDPFAEALNDKTPNLHMVARRTVKGPRNETSRQETWISGRRLHLKMKEGGETRDMYVKSGSGGRIVMVFKGQGMQMDMSSPMFQQMRQAMPVGSPTEGLKKTGKQKVAGRECEVYEGEREIRLPMGAMKQKAWVCLWKGVALKAKHSGQGTTVEVEVEEIKEGGASDSDLEVPAGVPVKEFKLPPGFGPPSVRPK